MHRSIATVSLGGGLQEKLYAAAAAKFQGVELFESDLTFFEGTPADIRQLLEELHLSITLFHSLPDFEGVADEALSRNLDRAERRFALMQELGAGLLLVPSNAEPAADGDPGRAAAQLHALAERAARHDIRIGYEPQSWGTHIRTPRDAWALVAAADHPNLGLVLDSFHSLAPVPAQDEVSAIPGERVFLLQLADCPPVRGDLESWSRHCRCFPGQGSLDIARFTTQVLATGYAGPLSLEIYNDELRAAPTRATALDGQRSLVYIEEKVRRTVPRIADSLALADPAPAPENEAVGFIEFAVDARSHESLGHWLQALGFAPAGQHRTKNVTLHAQGDLLIVLNAGTDTFARSYHHLHGTSVCAIGMRLGDPAALLARADSFGYKRYQERIGPQEYRMPAVRAPDGSLIHLLDDSYDPWQDFVRVANQATEPALLQTIDHVARAVPAGQFDSWFLFYRALLGLEPDESWLLPDPHGFVRSRALHDRHNRIRFPLAYSESNRTLVARSLSTFGGAGVNQIAFGTDDIFAAVDAMRTRGARLLMIPANYYAELKDAHDLTPALLARLQAHNVLYDRDAQGGEFFHAYTELFEDRFFFEVVQRRSGYSQYGAANAPVRMAAQAKRRAA